MGCPKLMPYMQLHHGLWRVRKPVPKSVQAIIGRGVYLTRSLGTSNRAEANRPAVPVIAEFDEMIQLAEKGEYPVVSLVGCDFIARQWASWADGGDNGYWIMADAGSPTFENHDRLTGNPLRRLSRVCELDTG
jgi:hypothetical protein